MKPRHPEKIKNIVSPLKKKPDWIRTKLTNSQIFLKQKRLSIKINLPQFVRKQTVQT